VGGGLIVGYAAMRAHLRSELDGIDRAGLRKPERVLTSPQHAHVAVGGSADLVNMCANNYLGLADHPDVIAAAHRALDDWGYGMASVRFICGTQQPHKQLEAALSQFLGTDDTILYSSCWDANGGLFEILLGPDDAVISDALNHASIIDGIRLCKARKHRYANNDMADLERQLQAASSSRFRLIVTDGVFSMDGIIADLPAICDLADRYDAMVMVDDSHAAGFIGAHGRGTPEHHGVEGRIDIITGTLGKALGGGSGGYTAARQDVVDLLRQRSRPYLFSNSLPPPVVGASLAALQLVQSSTELRDVLEANTRWFREAMTDAGFDVPAGVHPIVPVMLGDARLAAEMAEALLARGVYVIAFSYPVVPEGKARIRTQLSALHSADDLATVVDAFTAVREELGR
jgi:glycine C-acetyltransferase